MMARGMQILCLLLLWVFAALPAVAQQIPRSGSQPGSASWCNMAAPSLQPSSIGGTVMDTNGDIVPGAQVVLEEPGAGQNRIILANDDAAFHFDGLKPGIPYHIKISVKGFVDWVSQAIVLSPGQFVYLKDSAIAIAGGTSSVTVYASPEEIAVEQVKVEEQ